IPKFLNSNPSPIGFISFDLDQYTSTVQAFELLKADPQLLLPRIHCHFDDIVGFTFGHHNGERLAISEFNDSFKNRQISKLFGAKFYVPKEEKDSLWVEKIYLTHIIDHALYNAHDGLVKKANMDL
ncbi:MAG: hypothetical protein HQL32_01160, partial [Planctomycetes bacterium]|nr:hypothetical protein [Planctomycetota bacterium]